MTSPWMDTAEACEYLRFVDHKTGKLRLNAFYEFLKRYRVPTRSRGGRSILIHRDDLDAVLKERS